MAFINFVVFCAAAFLIQKAVGEPPNFRILAPPFVCPKDKDAVIDKPDNTVVTLQTDGNQEVKFHWTVRWQPLVAPTQRYTLELWRTVRELENKLNRPQIEPNVFIINNTELLTGVEYIFNVTATSFQNDEEMEKVFHIDNIKGDPKLLIEGRSEMFSVNLIGGQVAYADLEYILDAQVTTCYRTQDYYFVWSVANAEGKVDVSHVNGSRLVIGTNMLKPGQTYDVLSQVFKYSNGNFITENSLPFRVLHRNRNVNFNVDVLVISIDKPFILHTDIRQIDYVQYGLTIVWTCTIGGETPSRCYSPKSYDMLVFPKGLAEVGEHLISVTVYVRGHAFEAVTRIIAVEPPLPIIEVSLMKRVLNENSITTLKATVTDMVPGCSITWYFKSERCISANTSTAIENCGDSEHGVPISAPTNFYSLEENFLSELTDYTNETGSKSVFADLKAATGTARVVVDCDCTENNCSSVGVVYADVKFQVNNKPSTGDVLVMPKTGTAMETVFRISTLAIMDPNKPLRYSFYCELNHNDTLMLGSYLEHLAVETFLPYVGGGIPVWMEVCDSLGACSSGAPTVVQMAPGEARTVDALLQDARAHVQRCELMMLRRLAASAIVTYTNAGQADAHTKFTSTLLDALDHIDEHCVERNYDEYSEFLNWLARSGMDTTDVV